MKIPPGHTDVSSTYLTDLLGAYLLESQKTSNLSEGEKANLEQNIQDTMAIFPKLQTGLDVNVKFNRLVTVMGPMELYDFFLCTSLSMIQCISMQ